MHDITVHAGVESVTMPHEEKANDNVEDPF